MRSSSTRRGAGAAVLATLLLLGYSSGVAYAGSGSGSGKSAPDKTATPTEVANDDDSRVPDPNGDADNLHPSGKDRHEDKGTQGRSASDPDDNGRGPERTNGGPDKPFATEDGSGGVDRLDQDGNNGCGNDDDFEDDNEGWCGQKPKPTHEAHGQSVGGGGGGVSAQGEHPKPCTEGSTMPAGSERDCDHEAEVSGTGTPSSCPKAGELPAGATMPTGCGHPEVLGSSETSGGTCPEAGSLPAGGTMPAGCLTTTTGGTAATTATLTPGAVLASALEGAASPAGERTEVLGIQIERGEVAAAGAGAPAGASVLGAVVAQGAALAFTGFGLTMTLAVVALALLALGFALRRFGRAGTEV